MKAVEPLSNNKMCMYLGIQQIFKYLESIQIQILLFEYSFQRYVEYG